MRDKKELWKLVNSITNRETLQKFSSKPFKPGFLDMVLSEDSEHAQKFYSEKELTQIKKLKSEVGLGEGTSKTTEKNQNQRVIRESDDEEMHSNSHSQVEATKVENYQTEWVTRKRRTNIIQEKQDEAPPKPAKRKSRKKIASGNVQELPVETRNRIAELNGTNTQFLMSKKLYNTDVTANNNRLSLPENSIKCEFLTEAEKECTADGLGMDVTVLDPSLREFSLVLKKWKMNSVFTYNLIKNWKDVVFENEFKEDHELQIWSFRINTKLYFVLNKV